MTYEDWIVETRGQARRYRAVRAGLVLALVCLALVLLVRLASAAEQTKPAPARVGAPIVVEWDAVEGAESYRVTVVSGGHRWPWDVREPRMLIPAPLAGRVYEVQVAVVVGGVVSAPATLAVTGRSKTGTSQAPSAPVRLRVRPGEGM